MNDDDTLDAPVASVIIPARNSASTLGLQLGALALQTEAPPFEVIVADNGSTDHTADVVAHWARLVPGLRMVDASYRAGPCAARNIGASEARSEKLLFCDADDAVQTGWVREMSRSLDEHTILGGKILYDALNEPEVRAWFHRPPPELFTKFSDVAPYASGCNLGIRRSALTAVGGWDESVTNYTDAELCFRVQRVLGVDLGFAPDAVVQYRYRSDLRSLYANMRRYGRAETALVERHAITGVRPRSMKSLVRSIGWLVLHVPDVLRGRARRGRFVRRFGVTIGRIEGALFGSGAPPSSE